MTSPLTTPTTEGRWTPRLWGTLLVLCAAMFLDALDVSMVGVALPSIGSELDLSTSTLQWIVSGYILGYGGLLLLGGRTADLLGRRQVFLVALGVFALASLLGGLVDSGPLLIASRFIKGLSAAFTAPAGLSIITTTFAEGPCAIAPCPSTRRARPPASRWASYCPACSPRPVGASPCCCPRPSRCSPCSSV